MIWQGRSVSVGAPARIADASGRLVSAPPGAQLRAVPRGIWRNEKSSLFGSDSPRQGDCLKGGELSLVSPVIYIDSEQGSDLGSGTESSPWRSLWNLRKLLVSGIVPGCQVFLREGRSWTLESELAARGLTVAPERIQILECEVFDNGLLTSGANIVFGRCVADCTVMGNRVYATRTGKGVDGLTLDSSRSGHVIACNWFAHHAANVGEGSDGDGVDLKGVRPAAGDPEGTVTVVRDNVMVDNRASAIVIHNGCKGLHIYNNEIWRNGVGIAIGANTIISLAPDWLESADRLAEWKLADDPCDPVVSQGEIYIYRNFIAESTREGIGIDNDGFESWWSNTNEGGGEFDAHMLRSVFYDIRIVHNTIDSNGRAGISMMRETSSDPAVPRVVIRDVSIVNNILSRNGRSYSDEEGRGSAKAYAQIIMLQLGDGFAVTTQTAQLASSPFDQTLGTDAEYYPDLDEVASFDLRGNRFWSTFPARHINDTDLNSAGDPYNSYYEEDDVWCPKVLVTSVYQYKKNFKKEAYHRLSVIDLQSPAPGAGQLDQAFYDGYGVGLTSGYTTLSDDCGSIGYLDDSLGSPALRLGLDSRVLGTAAPLSGVHHLETGFDIAASPDIDRQEFKILSLLDGPDAGAWRYPRGSPSSVGGSDCTRPYLDGARWPSSSTMDEVWQHLERGRGPWSDG